MLFMGAHISPETRAVMSAFGEQPETVWMVWAATMLTSVMMATGFYRMVEWTTEGCLIAVKKDVSHRVSFFVTNIVAIAVLLSVNVSFTHVIFALATAAYLEVHGSLMEWFAERR